MPTANTNDRQIEAAKADRATGTSAGPAQRVLGWLRGSGAATTGATGAKGRSTERSSTSRFIVGSVAFILIAEVLTYLIALANAQWKLGLNSPVVSGGPSFLTWYFLINVVIIVGVWVTMQRLGFFPRDRFAPRNGTTARGATGGSGNGRAPAPANQIPGIGKQRTRAARRHAVTTTSAVTKAAAPSARRVAAESRAATPVAAPESSEHDEVYDRVKAAQRLRRRRDARR